MSHHVALLGASGQLGFELQRSLPNDIELHAFDRARIDLAKVTSNDVIQLIQEYNISHIINAAAYTAVDTAEDNSSLAMDINAWAVKQIARACAETQTQLIHFSTDFVFDGEANRPYTPNHPVNPQSAYGKSKEMGERYLFSQLPSATCIRTAWVYSCHGDNFVKTMLQLMNERSLVCVVADQTGTPTWANDLAHFAWELIQRPVPGILHYSNLGMATWYDFACAIQLLGLEKGLLQKETIIKPIPTAAYPSSAKRPTYSVLDKDLTIERTGTCIKHWLPSLSRMMDELL